MRDIAGNFFKIENNNRDQNKISISIPYKENSEQLKDFPDFKNKFIVSN